MTSPSTGTQTLFPRPAAVPWAPDSQTDRPRAVGDYSTVNGRGSFNVMLAEMKHQFSRQFMDDAQFTSSKSMTPTPAVLPAALPV